MPDEKLNQLLHVGAESVSGAAGAALGLIIAGPVGAIVGGAIPPLTEYALKSLLGDVASREMSSREQYRVGTAAAHAVNCIYERLIAGEKPRHDGFFERLDDDRSPAETVLEGVLTTCRLQWEERKVPWIANIYVNAAFSDYPAETINRAVVLAERMTWRQYVILSLASRDVSPDIPYDWQIMSNPQLSDEQEVLRQELRDLYAPTFGLLTTDPLGPTVMGRICAKLMGLEALAVDDIGKFFKVR